jgi:hypothetical protein
MRITFSDFMKVRIEDGMHVYFRFCTWKNIYGNRFFFFDPLIGSSVIIFSQIYIYKVGKMNKCDTLFFSNLASFQEMIEFRDPSY